MPIQANNPARVRRIERIATAYIPHSGTGEPEAFATDLATDLHHWCAAKGVRFAAVLYRAQMHVTAERLEALRAPNAVDDGR